ncbi:MAG: signal peptidase I [Nitrospiraceae bacterium]|nr:signal peptidase I [Nitrospiraceae bacterium]
MSEEDQVQSGKPRKTFYKEWIEPFLIAAVIALFIRQFVVEAFKIPSGSMIPTLAVGDHLLVNKFVYGPRIPFVDSRIFSWYLPKRGDIIVFRYPGDEDKNFIKRIIGLPGDKIQIVNGTLMINDEPVRITPSSPPADASVEQGQSGTPRFYREQLGTVSHEIQYLYDQAQRNDGPWLVPPESVFVMGDNRDNSQDSRVWGFVKFDKILGKALIIYWSWDGEQGRLLRWNRIGQLIK